MLKSILNLKGAQGLSKSEQEMINGGGRPGRRQCCDPELHCCTFGPLPPGPGTNSSAVAPCCSVSWSPYDVCYSTGGPFGVECI